MATKLRSWVAILVLAVVPLAAVSAADSSDTAKEPTGPRPARPDILLITLDTTRADALGCFGGNLKTTPNLDRVAGRSHLFERCEASVPQTMPSHTTIFSGLHPFNHGVRKNLAVMVGSDVPLVTEELHRRGYSTGAFVSSFVVDGRFGLARGFEHFDGPDLRPRDGGGMERRAAETVRAAVDWIGEQEAHWFAWVHLFDPHAPYDPPEPFASRFPDSPYHGEVAYMDNEVGRLIGALVAQGLFDSTVVVIAGDHGESLGEHGEETHGILLYEATTRVPLLIHMPGQKAAERHSHPVGLIDIAPTIREMVGIETPGDGRSLLPVLEGKNEGLGGRILYIESLEGYLRNGWAPLFALVGSGHKYIEAPKPELYDLGADPDESRDLLSVRTELADAFGRRLTEIRPENESFGGETIVLSADEEAALLALGYVEGSPGAGAGTRRNPMEAIHLAPVHQQALEAKAAGDLDRAAALFRRELGQDPESPVLLWYLGSCLVKSDPKQAEASFRNAIDLRPDFEAPYLALGELLLARGKQDAAGVVATDGIGATFDADGGLHLLRAAVGVATGRDLNEVMTDLAVAIERAARPGPAYRLRAAIRLGRLEDVDGAIEDLESFAEWSTGTEIESLRTDPSFTALRDDPRFRLLVGD